MAPPVIRTLGGCLYWRGGFVLTPWTLCYQKLAKKKKICVLLVTQSTKHFTKVGKVEDFILRPCTILELILSDISLSRS